MTEANRTDIFCNDSDDESSITEIELLRYIYKMTGVSRFRSTTFNWKTLDTANYGILKNAEQLQLMDMYRRIMGHISRMMLPTDPLSLCTKAVTN